MVPRNPEMAGILHVCELGTRDHCFAKGADVDKIIVISRKSANVGPFFLARVYSLG